MEVVNWIRKFSMNFLCPIYKSVLIEMVSLKDCMHRFCEKSIKESINSRNCSCPLCLKKIATVRNICRDAQFDVVKKEFYEFWMEQDDHGPTEDKVLIFKPKSNSEVDLELSVTTSSRATGKLYLFSNAICLCTRLFNFNMTFLILVSHIEGRICMQ